MHHRPAGAWNTTRSLEWLQRAVDRRDAWLWAMSLNAPFFDPVRGSERFRDVVRKMGLDVDVMTTGR